MRFGVSTFGYGFLLSDYFVNLCQRLSTHHFGLICLYFKVLGNVNNVNCKTGASDFSKICHDVKKTIRFGQS